LLRRDKPSAEILKTESTTRARSLLSLLCDHPFAH
jgi:hypothetical protein